MYSAAEEISDNSIGVMVVAGVAKEGLVLAGCWHGEADRKLRGTGRILVE